MDRRSVNVAQPEDTDVMNIGSQWILMTLYLAGDGRSLPRLAAQCLYTET